MYTLPKPTNGTNNATLPKTTSHSRPETKLYRIRYCVLMDEGAEGLERFLFRARRGCGHGVVFSS
jgi:hypothetical protein